MSNEMPRALWAIPYPGGPNNAACFRGRSPTRRVDEPMRGVDAPDDGAQRDRGRPRQREDRTQHRTRQQNEANLAWEAPVLPNPSADPRAPPRSSSRLTTRAEGEVWASRTEEEGSIIVACCDETVKFFEVWAGKSKGRGAKGHGLGSAQGVLGGSPILEREAEGLSGADDRISGLRDEIIR